jgi:hypothetical protein
MMWKGFFTTRVSSAGEDPGLPYPVHRFSIDPLAQRRKRHASSAAEEANACDKPDALQWIPITGVENAERKEFLTFPDSV